ncbi:hypothetical protein ABIC09_006447 [Bradyrhizobium sp. S3.12.5]
MENVRELPADSTRAILSGLGIQQRERARALRDLARLRREARDEIGRLIQFLGASNPYVMTELEGRCLACGVGVTGGTRLRNSPFEPPP